MAIDIGALENQLGRIGTNMAPKLDLEGAARGYTSTLGAIQYPTAQRDIVQGLQNRNPNAVVGGLAQIDPKSAVDFWSEMERNKAQLEANKIQRQAAIDQNEQIRAETAYGKTMSLRGQLVNQYNTELQNQRPEDAANTKKQIDELVPVAEYQLANLNRLNPSSYQAKAEPANLSDNAKSDIQTIEAPQATGKSILEPTDYADYVKDGVITPKEKTSLMDLTGAQSAKDFDNKFASTLDDALSQIKAMAVNYVTKNATKYAGNKGRMQLAKDLSTVLGLSESSPAHTAAMEQQTKESSLVNEEKSKGLGIDLQLKALNNGTTEEKRAANFFRNAFDSEKNIGTVSSSDVATIRGYGQGNIASMLSSINRAKLSPQASSAMLWVDNLLRAESGAAIGKEEAASFLTNYIPMEGDDAAEIARKKRAREMKLAGMLQQAGVEGKKVQQEFKAEQEQAPKVGLKQLSPEMRKKLGL